MSNVKGRIVDSLPDYQQVSDPVAREWMRSMTNTFQVRNGDIGTGEHKFLTKADLSNLVGQENFQLLTADPNSLFGGGGGGTRSSIRAAIRAEQQDLASSRLSLYLGQLIDNIKKPLTGTIDRLRNVETGLALEQVSRVTSNTALLERFETQFAVVNDNIAIIQNYQSTITTNFSAQALLINSIQARLDDTGDGVKLEQRFQALIDADNFLYGQYTLKIEIDQASGNRYVAGFGLSVEIRDGKPFSRFLVRADQFGIGLPGITDQIPFIVRTDDHTDVNGVRHPRGAVYIESALLGQFVADQGNIGNLTVGTLKIKDNAVTVPSAVTTGGAPITYGVFVEVASLVVDFGTDRDEKGNFIVPQMIYIHGMTTYYPTVNYTQLQIDLQIVVNGNPLNTYGQSFFNGAGGSVSCVSTIGGIGGVVNVSLRARQSYSPGGEGAFGASSLVVIGAKK